MKYAYEFRIGDVRSVYDYLEERDSLHFLQDPLVIQGTREIHTLGKSRYEIENVSAAAAKQEIILGR